MEITIYELKLTKTVYTEKQDWLVIENDWDKIDCTDWDEFRAEILYFTSSDEMNEYIEGLTKGFHQHSWEIHSDNTETLEYFNGEEEWDVEYYFDTDFITLPSHVTTFIASSINER